MRSWKNAFQSRDCSGPEAEAEAEAEAVLGAEEMLPATEAVEDGADADVEACRQSEGVKKDDGVDGVIVVVVVDDDVVEGLLLPSDREGREGDACRALDERCRLGVKIWEVRRTGPNVELDALQPKSSTRPGVRIVVMGEETRFRFKRQGNSKYYWQCGRFLRIFSLDVNSWQHR